MGPNDYDLVSTQITSGTSIVTVIVDPEPFWCFKKSATSYARLVNAFVLQWGPKCQGNSPNFFVGGHSASGMAAAHALPFITTFEPVGFIGLDPYSFDSPPDIHIPGLFWGFSDTTCFADVNEAAKPAYVGTGDASRVLYQIQNDMKHLSHCSFTDDGCGPIGGIVCPANPGSNRIRESVGESVKKFVAQLGTISKEDFEEAVSDGLNVVVYANEEAPLYTEPVRWLRVGFRALKCWWAMLLNLISGSPRPIATAD
eukprot:CAMPEP_0116863294 /NCGR_PEP_ID=MMETSP0418-20121206/24139_1 /TAXON_ID=1158023 /ORGANISM="Astrosyne radiata, Strain 13vi08-1A" /LENGTH=255 /DNA_ID=CAMNT_0004498293 /DNA_START=48 /DNA_END=816 /DNA_ORIENTATION=+